MTLQIEGQISIFDIMPYIKEEDRKLSEHNCPYYMFIKNGVPYAKKTCLTSWTECGQCQVSKDFGRERDRFVAEGCSFAEAIDKSKDLLYAKYGEFGEKIPA